MEAILYETPRLAIRPFTLADAQAVYTFNSNSLVTKYTGDAGRVTDLKSAREVIEKVWLKDYQKYGYGRYALIHKADSKVIGFTGLKYLEEEKAPDLGYRMLPEYWGKGLGFEAAQASLKDGFERLQLTRVIAMATIDNNGSNRILTKLGFTNLGPDTYQGHSIYRYEISKGQIKEQNEAV